LRWFSSFWGLDVAKTSNFRESPAQGVAMLVAHGQTNNKKGTQTHAFPKRPVKSHLSVYVQHGDVVLVAVPPFLVLGVCNIDRIESMVSTGLDICQNVLDLGFRIQDSGFRVQGSGFGIQGSGFRVQGSGFGIQGSGFRVQGWKLGVGDWGLGFQC
jgi:hypothetical protein